MFSFPRILDDLTGATGVAFSAINAGREEIHSIIRTKLEDIMQSLDIVSREEFDIIRDVASRARQESNDLKIKINEQNKYIEKLEARIAKIEDHIKH